MPLPNQREKVRGSLIYGPHTWFLVTPLAQRQRGHWRGSDMLRKIAVWALRAAIG